MQDDSPFLDLGGDSILQQLQKRLQGGTLSQGATLLPTMIKPVMTPEVENSVLDALSQYRNQHKWKQWGMDKLRPQGPCILLTGTPGNGKTMIAKWISKQINKGMKQLSAADLGGGGSPGDAERAVNEFYQYCKSQGNMTVFIDECDHLLLNRSTVTETTWQVGTTETIMMNMASYGGMTICATNFEENLDPALEQRFLAIIRVPRPDHERRLELWRMKIPASFPFRPEAKELHKLANFDLNGRQIENVILNTASRCIRKNQKPTIQMFSLFCKEEQDKHIHQEDK